MISVFKNLYKYRELLKTNIKKEIRGKYKNMGHCIKSV